MGQKWSLPLVRVFFQILKKVPKRFKTVPKMEKMEKIKKKKIKNLTLECNLGMKNGHFWSYVDAALVFFEKITILTLGFRQLFTDKMQKYEKMFISIYFFENYENLEKNSIRKDFIF